MPAQAGVASPAPWQHTCPPWRLDKRKLSDLKIPPDAPRTLVARPVEPSSGEAGGKPDGKPDGKPAGKPDWVMDPLAASIKEHGLLVPVLIEPDGTVRGGIRRLAALKSLGRLESECLIIPPGTDPALVQLIENLQRTDLSPVEEARAFRRVLDRTGWKQVRLARELGISEAHVSLALNMVKPEGATPEVLEAVERGQESAYAVQCAFSKAGRRDGRAEEVRRRVRLGDVRRARFSSAITAGVRVPARRLPEGIRARVFTDRVEVAFVAREEIFPLSKLPGPDGLEGLEGLTNGLAKALRAALGGSGPQATAALIAGLREARRKVLRMDGLQDDGESEHSPKGSDLIALVREAK